MNRKELILDFIKWFVHHHVDDSSEIKTIINQENTVDEYLEMLDTIEDLNDNNQLKLNFTEDENV